MEENLKVNHVYSAYIKLKHFFTSKNFAKGFMIGIGICSIMGLMILICLRCIKWYRNPNTRPRILHRTKRHHFGKASSANAAKNCQKKCANKPISVHIVSKNVTSKLTSAVAPDVNCVLDSVENKVREELKLSNTYQEGKVMSKRATNSTMCNMIKGMMVGFAFAILAVATIFIAEWYCGPGSIELALQGSSNSFENVTSSTAVLSTHTPVNSTYKIGDLFVIEEDYMSSIVLIVATALISVYRCVQRVWFPERRRVWLNGNRGRYYVN